MFRKVLDAEMKVLHACAGEDYAGKAAKAEREGLRKKRGKRCGVQAFWVMTVQIFY